MELGFSISAGLAVKNAEVGVGQVSRWALAHGRYRINRGLAPNATYFGSGTAQAVRSRSEKQCEIPKGSPPAANKSPPVWRRCRWHWASAERLIRGLAVDKALARRKVPIAKNFATGAPPLDPVRVQSPEDQSPERKRTTRTTRTAQRTLHTTRNRGREDQRLRMTHHRQC